VPSGARSHAARHPGESIAQRPAAAAPAQRQQQSLRMQRAALDSYLSTRIDAMNLHADAVTPPLVIAPLVVAIVASLAAYTPTATKVMSAS